MPVSRSCSCVEYTTRDSYWCTCVNAFCKSLMNVYALLMVYVRVYTYWNDCFMIRCRMYAAHMDWISLIGKFANNIHTSMYRITVCMVYVILKCAIWGLPCGSAIVRCSTLKCFLWLSNCVSSPLCWFHWSSLQWKLALGDLDTQK